MSDRDRADGDVETGDGNDVADRLAVTGTPGTGKTAATKHLADDVTVHHLNDVVREEGLHEGRDETRDSLYADLDAVADHLGDWSGVAESHLAHHLDVDRVVVLRCRPDELRHRLESRGEPDPKVDENDESEASRALAHKVRENAESEALDVVLSEAVQRHGRDAVYEIDTTDLAAEEVATRIDAVRRGAADPAAGTVDFTEFL